MGESKSSFYDYLAEINKDKNISGNEIIINRVSDNIDILEEKNLLLEEIEVINKTFNDIINKGNNSDVYIRLVNKSEDKIEVLKEEINNLIKFTKLNIKELIKEGINVPEELTD